MEKQIKKCPAMESHMQKLHMRKICINAVNVETKSYEITKLSENEKAEVESIRRLMKVEKTKFPSLRNQDEKK